MACHRRRGVAPASPGPDSSLQKSTAKQAIRPARFARDTGALKAAGWGSGRNIPVTRCYSHRPPLAPWVREPHHLDRRRRHALRSQAWCADATPSPHHPHRPANACHQPLALLSAAPTPPLPLTRALLARGSPTPQQPRPLGERRHHRGADAGRRQLPETEDSWSLGRANENSLSLYCILH
jgi:hypothetical protein